MDPGRVYWRFDLEAMAPRLRIFREHAGELMFDEDLDLVLWGRAYLESDWHFRPLDGLPARIDDRWHIAMGHGHFVRTDGDYSRSLLIPEEQIAGAAGQWDYLALGHVHVAAQMRHGDTLACYPGSPLPPYSGSRHVPSVAIIDLHPGRDAAVRLQPLHIRE